MKYTHSSSIVIMFHEYFLLKSECKRLILKIKYR